MNARAIPRYATAVLEALRSDHAGGDRLRSLSDEEFQKALQFCDRSQLTLTLNHFCRDALPEWVRARIDRNLIDYSVRFERLKAALFEIAAQFERSGIEFVVLKGLAHSPDFTPDPVLRAQGDIDIWCKPDSVLAARDELLKLGYFAVGASEGRHLPPMIRQPAWEWRGDFFASDLPISVELHYRLWDEEFESICAPGEEDFWQRRVTASVDGRELPVLDKPDALAFASLHLLMHVLHGDLRVQRAWEIANFLDSHALDDSFWLLWHRCHAKELRQLEALVFGLVAEWFGCRLSSTAAGEIENLPDDIGLWMTRYAFSPVEGLFQPNKDEIWLHLALVGSLRDKFAIFRRRVLPVRLPPRIDPSSLQDEPPTRIERQRHLSLVGTRFLHHGRALIPTLARAVQWSWQRQRLGAGVLRYQLATALYSIGGLIFFLLYNLYLLGLGFHEDVLGRVASAMSLGTLAGTIPAAAISRRIGLRRMLLIALTGAALAMLLRASSVSETTLMATAFLHGLFLAFWAVSHSPAIAGLTTERNRQFAFGLVSATAISLGVLSSVVGGQLPGLLRSLVHSLGPVEAHRWSLILAAGLILLAALPLRPVRFPRVAASETRLYPRGRFLPGFLLALAVWGAAMGGFNPFFNAFFSHRMRMSTEGIGAVSACAHLFQAIVMLLSPVVLKRLGDVKGIASMQLATALALAAVAASPAAGTAATAYVVYMSFQYMSEPGLFSMLMNRVSPGERSGASALYFLVSSLVGSAAAFASGAAIARFGYPPVLFVCATVAALSAVMFRALIRDPA